jgi:hypothetical protein
MATKKQAAKSTAKKDKAPFPGAKKVRTVVRDAATGKLAPKSAAKANPKGTVTEKVTTGDVVVKVSKAALKMPKSLAGVADALYITKQKRLAAQKEIAPLGEFEKTLKEYLINNLPKSQAEGISGKTANAKIVRKEIPYVEDEKKILAFAKKPGNEDLIKISVNMEAVEARWEAGKTVPGVGKHTVVTVSSTKLK